MCTLRKSMILRHICLTLLLVTHVTAQTNEPDTSTVLLDDNVILAEEDFTSTEFSENMEEEESTTDVSEFDPDLDNATFSSSTDSEEWSTGGTWTTFPTVTIPNDDNVSTTFQPSPGETNVTAGPPTWALILISIMICFSVILTGLFLVRKYCARRRKEERRYLLSQRSQEGYFFGETGGSNDL